MLTDKQRKESSVKSTLRLGAIALGAMQLRVMGVRGWPDLHLYWFFDVADIIETKRPVNGRYEALQLNTHEELRKRGHNVLVINTLAQVAEYLESRKQYSRAAFNEYIRSGSTTPPSRPIPLRQACGEDDPGDNPDAQHRVARARPRTVYPARRRNLPP